MNKREQSYLNDTQSTQKGKYFHHPIQQQIWDKYHTNHGRTYNYAIHREENDTHYANIPVHTNRWRLYHLAHKGGKWYKHERIYGTIRYDRYTKKGTRRATTMKSGS